MGAIQSLNTTNFFFYVNEMIVVGYGIGIGAASGDVQKDDEGKKDMKILGQNIAWLLNNLITIAKDAGIRFEPFLHLIGTSLRLVPTR